MILPLFGNVDVSVSDKVVVLDQTDVPRGSRVDVGARGELISHCGWCDDHDGGIARVDVCHGQGGVISPVGQLSASNSDPRGPDGVIGWVSGREE